MAFDKKIFWNLLPPKWKWFDEINPSNKRNIDGEQQGQLERMLQLPGVEAKNIYDKITNMQVIDDISTMTDETLIDHWLSALEIPTYGLPLTLDQKKFLLDYAGELNQRRGRFDVFRFVVYTYLNWSYVMRKAYENTFRFNDENITFFDKDDTVRNAKIGSAIDAYCYFFKEGLYDAGQLKIIIYAGSDTPEQRAAKLEILKQLVLDWLPFGTKVTFYYIEDLTLMVDYFTTLDNWAIHAGVWTADSNNLVCNMVEGE